jgi:hypothetical protein
MNYNGRMAGATWVKVAGVASRMGTEWVYHGGFQENGCVFITMVWRQVWTLSFIGAASMHSAGYSLIPRTFCVWRWGPVKMGIISRPCGAALGHEATIIV